MPAKNLKELIDWVKENQDKIAAGTAGAGSASHVSGVYFQTTTGTKFTFVPYRGTGPAIQDLVAGQIDIMVDQSSNSLPQVQHGKIKAYAVDGEQAPAVGARYPDRRRGRTAGILHLGLARRCGCRKARRRM